MRLWSFLVIPFLVTLTYGAPVSEVAPAQPADVPVAIASAEPAPAASEVNPVVIQKDAEVAPIPAELPAQEAIVADEVEATTVGIVQDAIVDDAVATTLSPVEEQQQAEESNRDARQLDDDEEEEEADDDDDDDDDEDEEDEEEDEEDHPARDSTKTAPKPKSGNPAKKVAAASGKPVPSLNEGGGEDDEAEDMGHFEGNGSPKSREATSDEAESEEEPDKEKANDEEDAEEDDDDSDEEEEADEAAGPQGLVAESSSTETQGAEPENEDADAPPSNPPQNEIEQPLAVAVVENEVRDVEPVVPVIVEESPEPQPNPAEQDEEPKKTSNKKNKDDKEDDDDEDDDDDDDEEDEEEDDNAARSEKVSQARAAYSDARDADVLYYYPYPDNSQMMHEEPYF